MAAPSVVPLSASGAVEPQPADAVAHISARGVSVAFDLDGRRQHVLSKADLIVPKGSFVSLIGPSGCGKSTLLKVLAGLIAPDAGEVRVGGLAPAEAVRRRLIGLVFQDATLLPWKTALDNAAFLLEVADKSLPRGQVRDRARSTPSRARR